MVCSGPCGVIVRLCKLYFTLSTLKCFQWQPWSVSKTVARTWWWKGGSRRLRVKLTSDTALNQMALTKCFVSDGWFSSAFKWSDWNCLLMRQQHQDRSKTEGDGVTQRITSCPSCPRMAERCRLSCHPSRLLMSNREVPTTPTYNLGHRVRTYKK